jgi:hypothetical protein
VQWFCLSVLEDHVWRAWQTVPLDERAEVRRFLVALLTTSSTVGEPTPPRLVRTKLAKVLVDVAKQDWPTHFPDFLPTVQRLVLEPTTLPVGLLLIKTMGEEFLSARDDVPAARKDELQRVRRAPPPQSHIAHTHTASTLPTRSS